MAWQGGNNDIHGGANVNDGQWHHFVGTSDAASNVRTLWIDGVQMASQGLTGAITSDPNLPIMVGENPQANAREWNGEIDDVAIWNRALTETEILQIFNAGQAGTLGSNSRADCRPPRAVKPRAADHSPPSLGSVLVRFKSLLILFGSRPPQGGRPVRFSLLPPAAVSRYARVRNNETR